MPQACLNSLTISGHTRGPLSSVEAYSPTTDAWTPVAPMHVPHAGFAAARGPDGRIYVAGGYTSGGTVLDTVEAYDPRTNAWTFLAPLPTRRMQFAGAFGSDGQFYAIGGRDSYSYYLHDCGSLRAGDKYLDGQQQSAPVPWLLRSGHRY